MTDTVNINDLGVDFIIEVFDGGAVVDISAAISLEMIFKKPSGVEITRTAALHTDGTDGKLKYANVANDLDEAGLWEFRGKVTFSAAKVFYTSADLSARQFRVSK